jgi:hypothetical protein
MSGITTRPSTVAGHQARYAATALCGSAGIGHLVAVQQHLEHGLSYVVFFLVVGIGQLALAGHLATHGGPVLTLIAAALTAALVSLYIIAVVAALPVGPHRAPEQAGWLGLTVVVAEIAAVGALFACLDGAARRWAFNGALLCGAALWSLRLTGVVG